MNLVPLGSLDAAVTLTTDKHGYEHVLVVAKVTFIIQPSGECVVAHNPASSFMQTNSKEIPGQRRRSSNRTSLPSRRGVTSWSMERLSRQVDSQRPSPVYPSGRAHRQDDHGRRKPDLAKTAVLDCAECAGALHADAHYVLEGLRRYGRIVRRTRAGCKRTSITRSVSVIIRFLGAEVSSVKQFQTPKNQLDL